MGHSSLIAAIFAAGVAFAQDDPADVLIRARDKLLARTALLPAKSCTETIESTRT